MMTRYSGPRRRSIWASPQAALAISALAFMGAGLTGRLWIVLSLVPVAVAVEWALLDGPRFQRLALWALFVTQFLMVAPWLQPEEINYVAYAVLLLAIAGGTAALSDGARYDATLGFAVWVLLSTFYSTIVLSPSPLYALLPVPVGIVGMTLLFSNDYGNNESTLTRALLVFAAVQSLLGLLQTVFDLAPFSALGGTVYSEPRNYLAWLVPGLSSQVRMATGTFEHFNGLGSLLSLAGPIAFGTWLQNRNRARLLLLLLISAGLVATFSRGALLGSLLGGVLVYWSKTRGTRTQALRVTLLALTGLLSGLALFGAVQEYAAATNNLASRVGAWVLALNVTFADPVRLLFGAGFGYFGAGFLEGEGVVTRLHSAPVQVLTELGIVGAGLFLLGVIPPVWRGLHSADQTQNVLAASAVAFLTHQVVENALFGFVGLIFFAVVALLAMRQRGVPKVGLVSLHREMPSDD